MKIRNKKSLRIIITLLVIIEISVVFLMYKSFNNEDVVSNKKFTEINNKFFAIMVEKEDGTYIEDSNWPGEEYKYNASNSGCVDADGNMIANSLTYDETTQTVILETEYTSYCYVYFDIASMLVKGKKFRTLIPEGTTKIIFTDEVAPNGVALTDVSEDKDGSIVAWQEDTTFKVSSQIIGKKILANQDSSNMFYEKNDIEYIDLSKFNTMYVKTMQEMFYETGRYATKLKVLGLSDWDTSKVTNMSDMFLGLGSSSTTFDIGDLSNWDTSKVTNMSDMFHSVGYSATTFDIGDLSDWDTSSVTDMEGMFNYSGYNATTYNIGDLSNWDTSEVTDMLAMFKEAGYKANWSLDCSKWNVSKVNSYGNFKQRIESKVKEPIWVN